MVAALLSWASPQRHLIEGWLVDMTAAARAAVFGTDPLDRAAVAVVTLGDRSLDSPELSRTPRALFSPVWAALTSKVLAAGAHSIAFDFILDYDASRLTLGGEAPLKDYDRAFLRLLHAEGRKGRVILGRSGVLLPARRFQQVLGARHLGLVEAPVGPGNVIRRMRYGATAEDGTRIGTLSGLAIRSAGVEPPDTAWLVPRGPFDTLPSAELIDVLRCADAEKLHGLFAGRVVFVGSALSGEDRLKGADRLIPDDVAAPKAAPAADAPPADPCRLAPPRHRSDAGHTMPGVFLHAAAADAVLSGWAPAPLGPGYRLPLTGAVAMAAAALAVLGRLRWSIPGLVLLTVGVFGGGVALLQGGVLLASADPLVAAPFAFAAGWAARITLLDREARAIRREFGRYLAPSLIERMIDGNALPELGGELREVTVMFADLSGFTRLSGEIPEKPLMQVLNQYLDCCAGIVQRSGGHVDKFIGDAVMAIWNAPAELPGHAGEAVRAGLEIVRAVEETSAANLAAGLPALRMKVAINTGPAIVGNVGSRDRMNYTVIGAAVNVAARMEDLPRVFRTPVIIGEATARAAGRDFVLLPVAEVALDGVSGPVPIYAPLAPAGADDGLPELVAAYARARRLSDAGRSPEALDLWQRLAAADWPGAGPASVMLERETARLPRQHAAASQRDALLGTSPD